MITRTILFSTLISAILTICLFYKKMNLKSILLIPIIMIKDGYDLDKKRTVAAKLIDSQAYILSLGTFYYNEKSSSLIKK